MFRITTCLMVLLGLFGCSRSIDDYDEAVEDNTAIKEISVKSSRSATLPAPSVGTDDWPWWRGLNGDNLAPDADVPTKFSEKQNVVWKTPISGRGHSTPTIVGDRIFLATADERNQVQSILCFDRQSGDELWQTEHHQGGFPSSGQMHNKSTHATCTLASDGERVFGAFLHDDAIWVTALDFQGNELWNEKVGPFDSNFGYAPSPAIYQDFVIVAADNQGGGFLAALNRKTGKIVWRKKRPAVATYSSPLVTTVADKDQLVISGANHVTSFDPATGEERWTVQGTANGTCTTAVTWKDLVLATGGYPESGTLAIRADGSGKIVWEVEGRNREKAYVPSMLVYEGYLYLVNDDGYLHCWNAESGKKQWQDRLGTKVSASPLLAGGNIYIGTEDGRVFVLRANPKKYELVEENKLGDEIFASPVAIHDRLFFRVAERSGGRQEYLYCIGRQSE